MLPPPIPGAAPSNNCLFFRSLTAPRAKGSNEFCGGVGAAPPIPGVAAGTLTEALGYWKHWNSYTPDPSLISFDPSHRGALLAGLCLLSSLQAAGLSVVAYTPSSPLNASGLERSHIRELGFSYPERAFRP